MSTLIYNKNGFKIIKVQKKGKSGFIVFNSKKDFEEGHTHIDNYNMCKHIIWCVTTDFIDKKLSTYLLKSLIRVSRNTHYQNQVRKIISQRMLESTKKIKQ